jgi:hypothetical protein
MLKDLSVIAVLWFRISLLGTFFLNTVFGPKLSFGAESVSVLYMCIVYF